MVVMFINGIADAFGQSLKNHAAKSMLNQVISNAEIDGMSREEILKFVLSAENTEY